MSLEIKPDLSDAEANYLRARLDEYNEPYAGPRNESDFGFAVRNDEGEVVAGLIGSCVWQWLHINIIWVSDELRGTGVGSELLIKAEKEGLRQNREFAMLNTFSFQARPFYERHGYQVIGEMKDFPKGHAQFRMVKVLA